MEPLGSVLARVDELRETFARRGRVAIEQVLDPGDAARVAADVRALHFAHVTNRGRSRAQPPFDNLFFIVEAAPLAAPSPARAFVQSIARGPLRDLIAAITGRGALHNRQGTKHRPLLVAHAYRRGMFLGAHDDRAIDESGRRSVALVWHASARWEPAWGGQLHFFDPDETWTPRFGALHLFDVVAHNRHEVTVVTGPEVRYSLGGWLYELP